MSRTLLVLAIVVVAGCATSRRCPQADLGGWMTDMEREYGVHRRCTADAETFVLQKLLGRDDQGRVTGWQDLATLIVPLARGESRMSTFECGGDVIAVVRGERVLRAWKIDSANRTFVVVPPQSVVCEPDE